MRILKSMVALGLAVTVLTACDSEKASVGDNPREVTVVGSGQVQGVPDTLTADVGIEFTAPDVTAAMNQTNDRQQAVINALAGAGVDRKDITTTEVSLQPRYDTSRATGSPDTAPTTRSGSRSARPTRHPTCWQSSWVPVVTLPGSTRSATPSLTTRS